MVKAVLECRSPHRAVPARQKRADLLRSRAASEESKSCGFELRVAETGRFVLIEKHIPSEELHRTGRPDPAQRNQGFPLQP